MHRVNFIMIYVCLRSCLSWLVTVGVGIITGSTGYICHQLTPRWTSDAFFFLFKIIVFQRDNLFFACMWTSCTLHRNIVNLKKSFWKNHVKKKYIQENFCQWYKHFFKMNKEKFLNNKLRKKSNLWNSIEYAFSIDWLAGQSLT